MGKGGGIFPASPWPLAGLIPVWLCLLPATSLLQDTPTNVGPVVGQAGHFLWIPSCFPLLTNVVWRNFKSTSLLPQRRGPVFAQLSGRGPWGNSFHFSQYSIIAFLKMHNTTYLLTSKCSKVQNTTYANKLSVLLEVRSSTAWPLPPHFDATMNLDFGNPYKPGQL